MKILVTGGEGFIGQHLRQRLALEGHDVISLDDTDPAKTGRLVLDDRGTVVTRVVSPVQWITATAYKDIDAIYHLACPASPRHYMADPIRTLDTAFNGTKAVLDVAKETGAKVLIASSSEIYGCPPEDQHPQKETYAGRVWPYSLRACYDAETEILTETGWVKFPALREGARVASLTSNGAVEYHVPTEIISYPYVGEMLRFVNIKYDLFVTPNHQLYVRGKTGNSTGKWRFRQADEQSSWPFWRVPTGARFDGEEREWIDFGDPPPNAKVRLGRVRMDDWLEFLGYYISEGCVHIRRRVRQIGGDDYNVADYNILIAQENPLGRAKILRCHERLGWNFFDSDHHQFRICSQHLAAVLMPLGKAGDKYIPREYLTLSARQSRILLDALILGDGSRKGECAVYYTKSRQLADDVQELALRCGFASNIAPTPGRELFRVNIRPPRDAGLVKPERVRYVGKVYCVNVENHVICVRRSGRAVWCGNCYDEGKRAAEALAKAYEEKHRVTVQIARIFNTFGPGMGSGDGRVVSTFIDQALRGAPLTVHGDGKQTRSLCYIDDLVEGLIRLMAARIPLGPMNLGNPEEITIHALAEEILALTGSASWILFDDPVAFDPSRRCPNISRARNTIGWMPTITRAEGLRRTIAWWKEQAR